jgi:hypothetical protein
MARLSRFLDLARHHRHMQDVTPRKLKTKTGTPGSRPSNDTKASHMALSPSAGLLHGGMTDVCAFAPLRLYVRDDCRSPMQTQTEARCWCYC